MLEIKINGVLLSPPNGFFIIAAKPKSRNPLDKHLTLVLCERDLNSNNPATASHVIWTHNTADNGFHNGLYEYNQEKAFCAFNKLGEL